MKPTTDSRSTELDDARRHLVEENLPLVHQLASRWRAAEKQNMEPADLVQVGTLGLIDAARRFDPSRGRAFRAFARPRVEGAIRDALRAADPLSRHERQGVRRLEDAVRELRIRLGREPEREELARELGWDADSVRRRQDDATALRAGLARILPEPSESAGGSCGTEDAFNSVLDSELKASLARAIRQLPSRQQAVLALYHGESLTLREVGDLLGVTESRVCQIHSAIMTRLRQCLRDLVPATAAA